MTLGQLIDLRDGGGGILPQTLPSQLLSLCRLLARLQNPWFLVHSKQFPTRETGSVSPLTLSTSHFSKAKLSACRSLHLRGFAGR